MSVDLASRHPSTQDKMRWLTPNPRLPEGPPAIVSAMFFDFGVALLEKVGDGTQLTLGLQHLIDAKDSAVRQAVADAE
jgi:hypothetical protein